MNEVIDVIPPPLDLSGTLLTRSPPRQHKSSRHQSSSSGDSSSTAAKNNGFLVPVRNQKLPNFYLYDVAAAEPQTPHTFSTNSQANKSFYGANSQSLYSGVISPKIAVPSGAGRKVVVNDATLEVEQLLNDNKIADLRKLLRRRDVLNKANIYLVYIFHVFQTAGIFLTALSHSSDKTEILLWIGIACNFTASIINTYERINMYISDKALEDITSIKNNVYIDETTVIIDAEHKI